MKKYLFQGAIGFTAGILGVFAVEHFSNREIGFIDSSEKQDNAIPVSLTKTTLQGNVDFRAASAKSLDAVVHVKTKYVQKGYASDPMFEFFFGPGMGQPKNYESQASGSGVILSGDGYIVTNNHVIENATEIKVMLNDKSEYTAQLIGADPSTDLAVLKIDAKELPNLQFANSDDVEVGEWVLAVGNPFNLTSTVTAGIVSAKARSINILAERYNPEKNVIPIESFIQTDAAVNPGNSGGALVDIDGNLIGINTAIASNTGSYAGYSFAVPSNLVSKVTKDLIEYGMVQRGYLGVSIDKVSQEYAAEVGLEKPKGVRVTGVQENGSAEIAGIKKDDVILKIDDANVNDIPELQEQVGRHRPGDKINVTVWRGGEETGISVTLRNKDGKTEFDKMPDLSKTTFDGVTFGTASSDELSALRVEKGVKIVEVKPGKLRVAGLSEGMIVTSIDNEPVTNPEDLVKILHSKSGGVLLEVVYPNGKKAFIGFGL